MSDAEELNAARVIARIETDLETVLNAYEAETVPPEIVLVALLKLVHRRAIELEIPFERLLVALKVI